MWRRWAIVALLWVGLSGLMPAAMACAADMPMPAQECCPDHDGCDDGNAPTPAQIECCALDSVAGAVAASVVEPAKRIAVDADEDEQAPTTGAFASSSHFRRPDFPPDPAARQLDQSDLWLATARLRL